MRRIVMLIVIALAVLGNSTVVMVKVPALIGMEERAARILLAEKGLRADVVRMSNPAPVGVVCGQGPAPGVMVMEKYEVRLYVSKGPNSQP